MQIISLNFISYLVSITTSLGLGFWVFSQSPSRKVNKYFLLFIIGIAGWLVSLFVFYNIYTANWILFVGRFNFAVTTLLLFFGFEFILVFPEENFVIKKWLHYLIALEVALLFLITLFTPLVDQNEVILGSSRITHYGPLYFLHIVNFFIFTLLSIAILAKKSKTSSKEDKARVYYVILGFAISAVFGFSTNILIPLLGYQDAADLGSFSILFLVFAFSYAIIKHHLFDVKVIAAELFVFVLCVILFINTFLSIGTQNFSFNVVILISVIVAGVFLIRSVIKEVEQREKIEEISKELEKAYVVEKKANLELQNLDKYKNDFLRQTQHDLKNPLTVIMGYVDLLIGGNFGKVPKKSEDVLKRIEVVAQEKVRDISNFLDEEQFKMGKGVVTLTPGIELFSILDEIVHRLSYQAESKGIYLKLEKPEKTFVISADREKLKSALFNVVDNSIKYTEKGGVDIRAENSGTVKIIISDTGIGIPQDKIKTIFETQFERTKEAKETAKGTGVGLYLSAQIIKLHNGKVWAESAGEGKGSTFYIELPVG